MFPGSCRGKQACSLNASEVHQIALIVCTPSEPGDCSDDFSHIPDKCLTWEEAYRISHLERKINYLLLIFLFVLN